MGVAVGDSLASWKIHLSETSKFLVKEQALLPQQLKGWMMIYDCSQVGGMMQIMIWYIDI